jgi:hypothetical protein
MATPCRFACVLIIAIISATRAQADLIHLRGGDTLDGQVLDDKGDVYRIRTTMGVSDIDKSQVIQIEKADPPWVRYEKEKASLVDNAEGHFQLARWCRKQGLHSEEKHHLQEVLRHQPDNAEARRLLGYVMKDGKWVKFRAPRKPTPEELAARKKSKRDDKLIADAITEYTVKVKAIYRGRLSEKSQDEKGAAFQEGRQKILELKDPLAIPAITSVLSVGNVAARKLMVEALSQFTVDESTMNLLVAALLDPSKEVRGMAAQIVARRKDPRLVTELCRALTSDEEFLIRNAASVLGVMKARETLPNLVAVLSMEIIQPVRVSRWVCLDEIYGGFAGEQQYNVTGFPVLYRPGSIGCMGPGTLVGTLTDYEFQVKSIYRTQVQEALIAITGKNLGFDRDAWLVWDKQHAP